MARLKTKKADFRLLFVLGWVVDYFFFLRLAILRLPEGVEDGRQKAAEPLYPRILTVS